MIPKHSIDYCPICGGGLCGIRICGVAAGESDDRFAKTGSTEPHGLVVCDECEAIWLDPDVTTVHQYADIDEAQCPICREPLWGNKSRWADAADVEALGWQYAVNHDLDAATDEGIV